MMKHFLSIFLSLLFLQYTRAQSVGSIRLWRNGITSPSYSSGRLQLYISEWGNVCGFQANYFPLEAADVACRQLGFTGASSRTPDFPSDSTVIYDNFGLDTSPTLIRQFNCGSDADDNLVLLQCSFSYYLSFFTDCDDNLHDVGLTCYASRLWDDPFPGMVRLQNGVYSNEGSVEVFCNGLWTPLCGGSSFTTNDANTVCMQLGYKGAQNITSLPSLVSLRWFNSLSCPFSQACISDCQSCPNTQTPPPSTCITSAFIQCAYEDPGNKGGSTRSECSSDYYPRGEGAVRLARGDLYSKDYFSGRVQVYYNGVWGNVCQLGGFNTKAADVICHQLGWTGASEWSYSSVDSFENDARPTHFSNIVCTDSSLLVLQQCSYSEIIGQCTDSDDVSVTCYTSRIWDSPFSGMVRLTSSSFINEGRVEVYCNGEWGTVCNRNIDSSDRRAICRQLGYTQAFTASDDNLVVSSANSSSPIWLDNLFCFSGTSYNCISECQTCPAMTSTSSECQSHDNDLTVQCFIDEEIDALSQTVDECQITSQDPGLEGSLILRRNSIDSPVHSSGVVVLYHKGQWGNICRLSSFSGTEADVICHQLTYTGASSWSFGDDSSFGTDTRVTVIDDMSCPLGSELTALQCDFNDLINFSCQDSDDVAVTCYTSRIWDNPFSGMVRLMSGDFTNEGRVEVYCSGHWGTVCDDTFGTNDAAVICRQLGYDLANQANYATLPGNASSPIWLNNLQCSSSSSLACISRCQACPDGFVSTCSHTEDATVRCIQSPTSSITYFNGLDRSCILESFVPEDPVDGSMILGINDTYSLSYASGRVVVRFNNRWNTICRNSFFSNTEADVICHQLTYSGASTWSYAAIDEYGDGSVPIGFSDLQCADSEYLSMFQCSYTFGTPAVNNAAGCNSGDEISVSCYTSHIWDNPFDGMIRLTRGNYHTEGLLEVYCGDQWGTVCDDTFGTTAGVASCRQLGYQINDQYDHLPLTSNTDYPIWFDDISCEFLDDNCLTDCQRCPSSQNHDCSHSEDVTLTCSASSSSTVTNRITSCQYSPPINVGAVIGGVVGGLVAIILLVIAGIFSYKKYKEGKCPDIPNPFRNWRSFIGIRATRTTTTTETPLSTSSGATRHNVTSNSSPAIPMQPTVIAQEPPQPFVQNTTVFDRRPPPPPYNPNLAPPPQPTSVTTNSNNEKKDAVTLGFNNKEPPPYDPSWEVGQPL